MRRFVRTVRSCGTVTRGVRSTHTGITPTLPLVDVSSFIEEPVGDVAEARKLHEACCNVGFFYIMGHGVPTQLTTEIRGAAAAFFAQSTEVKMQSTTTDGFRGYQWLGQNVTLGKRDQHEAFDLHREISPAHHLRATDWANRVLDSTERSVAGALLSQANPVPTRPPQLRQLITDYVEQMLAVGDAVTRMMAVGLGDEHGHLQALTRDPWWIARLIHYPPLPGQQAPTSDPIGCGAHTDYGLLTIIGSETPGMHALEVLDTHGQWVKTAPPSGAFTCNIGDMMALISGGRYVSTRHRVLNDPCQARFSIPFFYEPAFDATISPRGITRGDTNEPPIVYGKHLLSKLAQNLLPTQDSTFTQKR